MFYPTKLLFPKYDKTILKVRKKFRRKEEQQRQRVFIKWMDIEQKLLFQTRMQEKGWSRSLKNVNSMNETRIVSRDECQNAVNAVSQNQTDVNQIQIDEKMEDGCCNENDRFVANDASVTPSMSLASASKKRSKLLQHSTAISSQVKYPLHVRFKVTNYYIIDLIHIRIQS